MSPEQESEFNRMRVQVAVIKQELSTLSRLAWLQITILGTAVAGGVISVIFNMAQK